MVLTLSYSSPALTITGNSTSIKMGNYSFSETINTVSALTMTDFTNSSNSRIAIHNGGSGNLAISNSGLGTNLLSLYSSAFTVPASGYALMTTDYIAVNSISTYFVKHN
jgi:hypothetical protein